MPYCEFSEDEFEDNLLHELRYIYGGGDLHYKPTRPQEKWIGYDFAVFTHHPLFTVPGIRVGASILTQHIPEKERWAMPVRLANAFVQCKSPYYVTRPSPNTREKWVRWLGPYYRIDIDPDQRETLARTAEAVRQAAVVCYAAPCFYRNADMDALVPSAAVVANTHFQDAFLLNRGKHVVYTYRTSEGSGWGFSEPVRLHNWQFLQQINRILNESPLVSVSEHFMKLWHLLSQKEGLPDGLKIKAEDLEAARRITGDLAKAPVEPFSERSFVFSDVVARVLRLRRYAREELGVVWITFAALNL